VPTMRMIQPATPSKAKCSGLPLHPSASRWSRSRPTPAAPPSNPSQSARLRTTTLSQAHSLRLPLTTLTVPNPHQPLLLLYPLVHNLA
jgi:hypothetical protein